MDHVSVILSHVQVSHNSLMIIIVVIILMTKNYGRKMHACKKLIHSKQRYLLLCLQWQIYLAHILKDN
jgi:hypothetical protein